MASIAWTEVEQHFEPNDGLRYVLVLAPERPDWQAMLDLVRAEGWLYRYTVNHDARPLPARVEDALPPYDYGRTLRVRPGERVWLHCHFFDVDDFEFDVDPADFGGQRDLDELCAFMRALGQRLRRKVLFAAIDDIEAFPSAVLFSYDPVSDAIECRGGD